MKVNSKILIVILVIAIVLLGVFVILISKPPITKRFVEQKFFEFKNQYQEKQAQGYDISEAEALAKQAKLYYDKGDYAEANKLLDRAFKALEKAKIPTLPEEAVIPSNLSLPYENWYINTNSWEREKLVDWKPSEYKPMKFTGFHLPISYMFLETDSDDDLKFLDMLDELDVDVIGVGVRAPEQYPEDALKRLDRFFDEVRKRDKELKIWYFGGTFNNKEAYLELQYRATKDIIERWHPDHYAVLHEPTTQEKYYEFDMSPEEWQAQIARCCEQAKKIDPAVKTSVTVLNNKKEIGFVDYFVKIPDLDVVGFDLYGVWGLDEKSAEGDIVGEKIDLIHAHGKEVWMEEGWLSDHKEHPETNPPKRFEGFDDPKRAWMDSKWIRVIAYYAQNHNMEAIEPFFTNSFILYPGYDPTTYDGKLKPTQRYIHDFKTALYEGKRTPTFYAFKDVIKENKEGS